MSGKMVFVVPLQELNAVYAEKSKSQIIRLITV